MSRRETDRLAALDQDPRKVARLPVTARKPTRAKKLGVDDDTYTAMLEQQGGRCALCPSEPKTRRLHVDHDHRTGAVRALLCHRCNRALAVWMTPSWLRRAACYLEDHALNERKKAA